MDVMSAVFRWLHVIAGIVWIGHLYFFNFVNIPFAAKMKEAGVGKTTVPELMPRALFWFRWGAAWTWITGVLLLLLVFYHGGLLFDDPATGSYGAATIASIALTFLGVFIYDALYKSPLAGNARNAAAVGFVIIAGITFLMAEGAGFSYRAYNIHIGAMMGTAMAFNVWFRIWPTQQKIIAATKAGEAPDAAWLALAGGRSRHNTYMSVPLIWTMIDAHTTSFASMGGYIGLLVMILLGWHLVFQFYAKSQKIEGF
jgi:uncharacterized membrane protein